MELQNFGETSMKCETAVKLYCGDKQNKTLDPGCFVDSFQSYERENEEEEEISLRFFCDEEDCFGVGFNFGSLNSRLHCPEQLDDESSTSTSAYSKGYKLENGVPTATATAIAVSSPRPFQNQTQLDKLGANQLFNEGSFLKANTHIYILLLYYLPLTTYLLFSLTNCLTRPPCTHHIQANRLNDVCNRMECTDNSHIQWFDALDFWVPVEIILATIFTLEACCPC